MTIARPAVIAVTSAVLAVVGLSGCSSSQLGPHTGAHNEPVAGDDERIAHPSTR